MKAKIKKAAKTMMKDHEKTFLKLRIAELEEQVKEWKEKYIDARKSGFKEGYEEAKEDAINKNHFKD